MDDKHTIRNSHFESGETPQNENKFQVNIIQGVCKDILEQSLRDLKYDAASCKPLAIELSERIRNKIFYPYINNDEHVCSDHTDDDKNQLVKMENILENIKKLHNNLPEEDKKFHPDLIKNIAEKILNEDLNQLPYDPIKCRQKAKELSERIRDAVKELGLERYRLVCTVSIGSLGEQGLRLASRCLWSTMTDASATAVFKNSSLFAVAIVFGVYME